MKHFHFFAYLSRMKYIQRWNLMRNQLTENIQEHSLQVSMIAHALVLIRNTYFGGNLDPNKAVTLGVFHEASEVITGDLCTPIKYFNPEIREAYRKVESIAENRLLDMLPEELCALYRPILQKEEKDEEYHKIVKAADKLSAYIKCLEELKAGNREFEKAKDSIENGIREINMPEVKYFVEKFIPSFQLTLDELN